MGICIFIDIEGVGEHDMHRSDGKRLFDLMTEITDSGTYLNLLSEENNIDPSPFELVSEEYPGDGPWQNPKKLWKLAYDLHQTLKNEGSKVIGNDIGYIPIKNIQELDKYFQELIDVVNICKRAKESGVRVRLTMF